MTLWHLLVMFSFVMPLSGALAGAHIEKATWPEYAAAIVVALIQGAAFAWAAIEAGRFTGARVARRPHVAERLCRLLYFGVTVWVIVGWLSGTWLARMLLRFI